ncbi:MAG TPA: hypothetical protein VGU45_10135 [Microvirga sp.]|nr:hypothetical protein [Microvirga sp.]
MKRASPSPAGYQSTTPPAVIDRMRLLVESTDRSFRSIADEVGVSMSTVSRLSAARRWRRPAGAPVPLGPRREAPGSPEAVLARAWRLADRHAAALEEMPVGTSGRALTALTAFTRILTNIERLMRAAPPPPPLPDPADAGPKRSIEDLHAELAATLDRIVEDERRAMLPDFQELLDAHGSEEDRRQLGGDWSAPQRGSEDGRP